MHTFKKLKIEKKKKIEQKSMKNRMFFGTSILKGFWRGFGRVLGGRNPRFSHFFRHFFEAKFRMQFGSAKNRKKRRQNDLRLRFGVAAAVCAALGGRKKDGGKATWQAFWHESLAWNLGYAFKECIFGTWTLYLARSASLREAADVLRTDRRTRRKEEKALGNPKAQWVLYYKHYIEM